MSLGSIIKQYREEHDLSLRAFGKLCNLSATYLSAIESGVTQRGNKPAPSIDTYRSIAAAMGVDIDTLIRAADDNIKLNNTQAKKPTVKDDELSEYDMEIMELLRLVPEERKPNVTAILKEHLRLSGLIE